MQQQSVSVRSTFFICGLAWLRDLIIGSAEATAGLREVFNSIRRGYPDWDPKVLTPEESVGRMLTTINGLKEKDTGAFLSETGSETFFV
jgi:hypothetical protein